MFHAATKLVIISEHFVIDDVCQIIEACGAKGYTMVPAGGKGAHHLHPTIERATVIEGFDNLKVEVILNERAKAEAIAKRVLEECFKDYPGVMYLEPVEICRPERF